MSSDEVTLLVACLGIIFVVIVALGYIVTSASRKKSKCPQCGVNTPANKAFIIEQSTGRRIEGEADVGYAMFAAIGNLLIGAGICAFVLISFLGALQGSCSTEGILLKCYDYRGRFRVETTINLPLAFMGALGGLSLVVASGRKLFRSIQSRGKPKLLEFVCPSCKHTWTEETAA